MPGPPTIRVGGSAFNTRCNMRLNFQAVVPTFNRRRPISQDGKTLRFTQDCPGRRNLQTRNDRIVSSELLSINDQFNYMHRA